MKKLIGIALLTAAVVLPAGDPAGFKLWKAAELQSMDKKLSTNVNQTKMASEPLAKFGNHTFTLFHRQVSGEAEVHEKVSDIFVVQSGDATLTVGGKVVGAHTTAPNEIRGTSIADGVSKTLAAGDVVHIPANTPHQLMVEKGKHFTYFVVKVNE